MPVSPPDLERLFNVLQDLGRPTRWAEAWLHIPIMSGGFGDSKETQASRLDVAIPSGMLRQLPLSKPR
jgi:hypothetical protein